MLQIFMLISTVKEFVKSPDICQSYELMYDDMFFDSQKSRNVVYVLESRF